MQETSFQKFIRTYLKSRFFAAVVLTSLLSLLLLFMAVSAIAWYNRAQIFEYFAGEYLRGSDNLNGRLEGQTLFSQEALVVDAVKKTNPAVVSILIFKEVPKYEAYFDPSRRMSPFDELFFGEDFLFDVPQYRQKGTEKKQIGGGSGFFVSSDGLMVTNKHVIDQTGEVEYVVFTNDGKRHSAEVVARDPVLDIALMKISSASGIVAEGFPFLSLGDSDVLQIGQNVIAIGNALGEYKNTVSVGIVSGLARSIVAGTSTGNTEFLEHVIQTDAAINPGNSGGPLLDLSGRVIGVNVAIAQGSQNIGFALPINSVKSAIESVKSTGKIIRPYLGIRYSAVNPVVQENNSLSVDYGVMVKSGSSAKEVAVLPGSPADKAGIVENDIILEVDGVKLDQNANLASIIRSKSVGQKVELKILHQGVEKKVTVTMEAAKDN
jgi:serine protease Do